MWLVILTVLLIIFELLRRKVIREKYAVVWLFVAALIIVGALFPNQVNKVSQILGFQVLSNFVLLFFGVITLFIVMQLSLALGKVEDQTQTLAEEIALLKNKAEQNKK